MMPANERKFWPRERKHEHILGEIRHIKSGDYRIKALMVYEESVERSAIPEKLPVTRMRLIGGADQIYCTICKKPVVDWHIGQDAIDALDEMIERRRLEREQEFL